MANLDMEDLMMRDLNRADEGLYYAARRYCIITERGFLQQASGIAPDDPAFLSVGTAASELLDAARRYEEARARWAGHSDE